MDIRGWFEEKTSTRALFGPNSIFYNAIASGTSAFYGGIQQGMLGGKENTPPSVIQGVPNWLLGAGIVYLAVRK